MPLVRLLTVFVAGALVMMSAPPCPAVVVSIGHRGASGVAPENTLAAVDAAVGKAWGVECDTRITSDGQIILMHNSTVDATTDGTGAVTGLTFAEIRSLDAGKWFSPAFVGEQVPTLSEQLSATSAAGLVSCLDIKAGTPADYLPYIQPYRNEVEIHAFNWSFLSGLNLLDSGFTLVGLGSGTLLTELANLPSCVDKVSWRHDKITTAGLYAAHAAGIEVYAWTVNDPNRMLELEQMGVDGIVTDYPALATSVLNQPPPDPPVLGEGLPRRLQDGLMMNWSFDDALGGGAPTTVAESVNGVNGALGLDVAVPESWQTVPNARLGGALKFDGVNDYVWTPPEVETIPTGNAVTLATWVKLDRLPGAITDTYGSIYDSSQDAYVLYLEKGRDELRFKVTAGAAARPGIPGSMLDTTQWHLVTGVYDGGAGVARIYLDGNLIDVHADDDESGSDGLIGSVGLQTALFGRNGTNGQAYFDGKIDETAVWDRALGQAEIAYLYNGGLGRPVQQTNPTIEAVAPVVRLEFEGNLANQGTAGAAADGQWIDGASGQATFESGMNGQSLRLSNLHSSTDGDGVTVPITLGDVGTITFWCRPDSFYNYQTLFDNESDGDDWEMWIDSGGVSRFRLESGSEVSCNLAALDGADEWYHMAVTWFRVGSEAVVNFYVDGLLRDVDEGAWADPGSSLFIGGGHTANDFANAVFDDFRIYDTMLATDEIVAIFLHREAGGIPEIPGDATRDGVVDEQDARRLAEFWGQADAEWYMGDFDGDGMVGMKDASILAANWGYEFSESAVANVPEPAMTIFVITALLATAVMGKQLNLGRGNVEPWNEVTRQEQHTR